MRYNFCESFHPQWLIFAIIKFVVLHHMIVHKIECLIVYVAHLMEAEIKLFAVDL